MHTYLLSDDAVARYGLDFFERLERLDAALRPKLWVALGVSGDRLVQAFAKSRMQSTALPQGIVRAAFDRQTSEVVLRDGQSLPSQLRDLPILIIDAAVHSGASMRHVADDLTKRGANVVLSYSLVVKKTAEFIPNYFGLVIDEHDRIFFQLDSYPNNRLRNVLPIGHLRALRDEDVHRSPSTLSTGVKSMDHVSFGDLLYLTKTQGSNVFVYEVEGRIGAYIHFKAQPSGRMFLDAIAIDAAHQGQRIGSLLMRWVETYARASRCIAIDLWAISNRVDWYGRKGYEPVTKDVMDLGGGETYQKMSRRILYNVKPFELMLPID